MARKWSGAAAVLLAAGLCFADDAGKGGDKAKAATAGEQSKAAADGDQSRKDSRWPRVRLGGVMVGAGYSRVSGYPYGWYGPWGGWGVGRFWGYPGYFYDPFFAYPWIHPGFAGGFGYGPGMGEVKLEAADKNDLVYVDGAFAGYAGKLKHMWLEPGAYNIEVKSGDREWKQRVYVLSGKRLTLDARSAPAGKEL